jgi:hypothetical protein
MSVAVIDAHPSGASVVYRAGHPNAARLGRELASVSDLVDVGARLHASDGTTQLWLTPRYSQSRAIADLDHAWTPVRWAADWPAAIVAPALNRRLGAALATIDGAALLGTLELISVKLGVGVQGAPAYTAELLLRGALARLGETAPLEPPALVTEPELSWIRPLDADELLKPWVLAIDRRGAYLQSMSLCDVGIGAPEHVERPDWRAHVWTPGLYHARIGPWREVYLPDPLRLGRPGALHWLTMPALRLGAALGLVEDVDEAWVWPRRSRVLRPVAQRILSARRAIADEAPELVRWGDPLLKRAYTELVGRLRWTGHRGTLLFRPDWHAHIVADARSRIWRAAWQFAQDAGEAPAAVATDAWYVLADRPELPAAFDPRYWRLDKAVPAGDLLECFELEAPTYSRGPVGHLVARVAEATR